MDWKRFLLSSYFVQAIMIFGFLFTLQGVACASEPSENNITNRLDIVDGYNISVYADDLESPRFMRITDYGDLLVSLPREGEIVLLSRDVDNPTHPGERITLVDDLNLPHGIDIYDGWLYIAETDAIGRIPLSDDQKSVTGDYERLMTDIPADGGHWTRTLRVGPDNLIYVSIGSSCNVCFEDEPLRATLIRFNPDGNGREILATGLRNSVGFDWSPRDGALYATVNGRDWLGDILPPDELNRIEAGGFYGWPYSFGQRVEDVEFIEDQDLDADEVAEIISESIPAYHEFGAHNAPLGIVFKRNNTWRDYQHAAFVGLHGSWNSSVKVGYKVVSLHWSDNDTVEERDFITGFEDNDVVFGRPVDVIENPDGDLFISDDFAGVIYRVTMNETS